MPFIDVSTLETDERLPGWEGSSFNTANMTIPDPEQLRTGAQVFYVKGVILYDDDFGSRQHSTFCRIYDMDAFDGKGGFVSPNKPGYNYGS